MNQTCKECGGVCCHWLDIPFEPTGTEDQQWLGVRGYVVNEAGRTYWRIYAPCKHLKDGQCSIWDHRPPSCADYEVGGGPCTAIREWDASQ